MDERMKADKKLDSDVINRRFHNLLFQAHIDCLAKTGKTPLTAAVLAPDHRAVDAILKSDYAHANEKDASENTALHLAVGFGQVRQVNKFKVLSG